MPNITKASPKQPQPASPKVGPAATLTTADNSASLENLDKARDLSGQKAQAAERYGASVDEKSAVFPAKKR